MAFTAVPLRRWCRAEVRDASSEDAVYPKKKRVVLVPLTAHELVFRNFFAIFSRKTLRKISLCFFTLIDDNEICPSGSRCADIQPVEHNPVLVLEYEYRLQVRKVHDTDYDSRLPCVERK